MYSFRVRTITVRKDKWQGLEVVGNITSTVKRQTFDYKLNLPNDY